MGKKEIKKDNRKIREACRKLFQGIIKPKKLIIQIVFNKRRMNRIWYKNCE